MDIKEIAEQVSKRIYVEDGLLLSKFISEKFAEALSESYKAELLKEVGEPVAVTNHAQLGYVTDGMHPDIPLAMWAKETSYSGANIALYTSDQVAAAIIKATKQLEDQLVAAQEEIKTVTEQKNRMWFEMQSAQNQPVTAEQRVAEACSRTVYVQADQIKKLTAERDAALARLSEERDIWDRMLGDAADKFAHLEREIDDCLYVLDALWDKQCDKIVTQKWAEILIRNKRVTGASSAEDSSEQTTA